jgi:CheY-like chemotaxis protein
MATATRPTTASGGKGRILLVEDTTDLRSLLRLVLEGEGYEVLEAGDGVAAVEVALRERPDAIIMDMSLPRLGGDQAAKLIRREPSLSRVPVIACTALNRWEWRGKSIVAGCDAFVTKPIDFDQLRQILAQLLARRAS